LKKRRTFRIFTIASSKNHNQAANFADELFRRRAAESEIRDNIEDFCPAPWMSNMDCSMHQNRSSGWNDDDIRSVRRNWLRGICPLECEGCQLKFSADLDLIKHSTDPDGYTKLKIG